MSQVTFLNRQALYLLKGLRVLVVEDEYVVARMMCVESLAIFSFARFSSGLAGIWRRGRCPLSAAGQRFRHRRGLRQIGYWTGFPFHP